jgi:hypothetical protein
LQALLVELLELKAHHAKALDSRTLLGHLHAAETTSGSTKCAAAFSSTFILLAGAAG